VSVLLRAGGARFLSSDAGADLGLQLQKRAVVHPPQLRWRKVSAARLPAHLDQCPRDQAANLLNLSRPSLFQNPLSGGGDNLVVPLSDRRH
jgi:hypothetical protein